jgi:hypothetical protein
MADASEILRRRVDGIIRPVDRWNESLAVVKVGGVYPDLRV